MTADKYVPTSNQGWPKGLIQEQNRSRIILVHRVGNYNSGVCSSICLQEMEYVQQAF